MLCQKKPFSHLQGAETGAEGSLWRVDSTWVPVLDFVTLVEAPWTLVVRLTGASENPRQPEYHQDLWRISLRKFVQTQDVSIYEP